MKRICKNIIIAAIISMLILSTFGCTEKEYVKDKLIEAKEASYFEELEEDYGLTLDDMSTFEIKDDKAYMSGIISEDTIRQVKELTQYYPEVKTIVMTSVEGSIDDTSNLIASRHIRKSELNTYIAADGMIASGGTDFFCAGIKRTVIEGAEIGVHSWGGEDVSNAALLPRDDKSHQPYIKYYKEMKLPQPENFYFFTIESADAENIYNMTSEEIKKYGISTE